MFNRLKTNQKGSLLVWISVVLLVITIFSTAVLSIGLAYTSRSTWNNSSRQAYFTARSAVNALGAEISEDTATGKTLLSRLSIGSTVNVQDVQFDQAPMGNCDASLSRVDEDTILISATATVGGRSRTVSLRLDRSVTGGDSVITGFRGVSGSKIEFGSSLTTGVGTDVQVRGTGGSEGGVNTGSCSLKLGANLLSKPGITISSGSYYDHNTVKNSIISEGPISLSGYTDVGGSVYSTTSSQVLGGATVAGETRPKDDDSIPLVSTLPKVTVPNLPSHPPEEATLIHDNTDFDKPLGISQRNTHYRMNANNLTANLQTASDAGNIFLYVPAGMHLNIDSMQRRSTNNGVAAPAPNVYVILEEHSSVRVTDTEFYGYFYGPDSSKVEFDSKVTVYGGIHAGNLQFDDLTVYYMAPVGGISTGTGSGGSGSGDTDDGGDSGFSGFVSYGGTTSGIKNTIFNITGGGETYFSGSKDLLLTYSEDQPLNIEGSLYCGGNLNIMRDNTDDYIAQLQKLKTLYIAGNSFLDQVAIGSEESPATIYCDGDFKVMKDSTIYGDIFARSVSFDDTTMIYGTVYTIDEVSDKDKEHIDGGKTKDITEIPTVEKPTSPTVLTRPDDSFMEELTSINPDVGYVGRDAYYYVNGNVNLTNLNLRPDSGRVTIYVMPNANLFVDDLIGGNTETPNLVVHLAEGASLTYNRDSQPGRSPFCGYVYGESGSTFSLLGDDSFYGGFYVDQLGLKDEGSESGYLQFHFTGDIKVGTQPDKPPIEVPTPQEHWSFGVYLDGGE